MPKLLKATNYAPYSKVLGVYADWVRNGAVYRRAASSKPRERKLSAPQNLMLFACHLAKVNEKTLMTPTLLEASITQPPFFGTFRSKEIWLDVFNILLNNPTWCCVSQTERDLIAAEIEIAGGTWTRAEEADKVDRRRYCNEGRVHESFQSRCSVTRW